MKKLFAIVLALALALCAFAGCGGGEEKTKSQLETIMETGKFVVAVSPDFAPSEFKNPSTGEVLGSDIFVAKYIADYMGVELVIEEMDFKSCQSAVATGVANMSVNSYAATDERKENYICSAYYGFTTDDGYQGVLVTKDKAADFATADSFSGKTLAVQNASLQYNLATAQLPADVTYEYISTIDKGALMLATGKVDGLVITSETGSLLCINYPDLAMAEFKLDYTSEGTVALLQLGQDDLAAKVNEALEKLNAEVNFTQMRQEYTDMAAELGVPLGG